MCHAQSYGPCLPPVLINDISARALASLRTRERAPGTKTRWQRRWPVIGLMQLQELGYAEQFCAPVSMIVPRPVSTAFTTRSSMPLYFFVLLDTTSDT